MKTRLPRYLFVLLFAYIAVSLTFQVDGALSLITGVFDLRRQVKEPVQIRWYPPVVTILSEAAAKAGLLKGDVIESINGVPFTGRAQMQAARWYAHPGETMRLGVRRAYGTRAIVAVPLEGYGGRINLREAVFA